MTCLIAFRISISIHALREEGDVTNDFLQQKKKISIHALREEGDRVFYMTCTALNKISIHALREEGDCRAT